MSKSKIFSDLCAVDVEAEPGGASGGQAEDVEAAARQEAVQLSCLGLKQKRYFDFLEKKTGNSYLSQSGR
jgi:hypothetical protein